jgi:thiol-disulfide isomerase/thioredoxin
MPKIVRFWCVIAATLLLFASTGCSRIARKGIDPGQPAPYARIILLDGEQRTLEQYRGRPLVLLFWGTWCRNSRAAAEELNQLAARYSSHASFVAVSLDRPSDIGALRNRIATARLFNLTHAFSGNEAYDEAYQAFGVGTIPLVVVLDARGTIVLVDDDASQVERALR